MGTYTKHTGASLKGHQIVKSGTILALALTNTGMDYNPWIWNL